MATFALIHGGGGSGWDWHLVAAELRKQDHAPIAVDLPCEDESAGWSQYVDVLVEAIGTRGDIVVVGHSLGGFTAPLVCARTEVDLLVLVAAMVPSPGEVFADWWANTDYEGGGYDDVFYHDVRPRRGIENATRLPMPCRSRGRWTPGPRRPPGTCSARRIECSRPLGHGAMPGSGSASMPTRWAVGTMWPSVDRVSWLTD